jgi:hypothetical protein
LHDLRPAILAADHCSDLARAANITALASMGKKSNRPSLVYKAIVLYSQFLESLQITLAAGSISHTPESMLVIAFLGIFEVCPLFMIKWTDIHADADDMRDRRTSVQSRYTLSWCICYAVYSRSTLVFPIVGGLSSTGISVCYIRIATRLILLEQNY